MTVSGVTYELATLTATLIVFVAAAFALLGVDDFLLDIGYWLHKMYRALVKWKYNALSLEELRAKSQQRIAIFIPCWHEHDIVERMVELASRTVQYAKYDIFIGVYPNDPLTVEKAEAVARRFARVRLVVNERDGPTTKGQNLNQMWAAMKRVEGDDPYAVVVLHDVEDVIHPISLLLYNYLIPRRDMVQLPVFPLERPWNKWTAWTYADEFSENHLKDLVVREAFGSFVPCAGVGCGFSRKALEESTGGRDELFPTESLTEDYQLGLHFRQRGLSTIMVHQRLAHKRGERYDLTAASYVATREFFPDTFSTAVRQKARWIIGICFQAWHETGWTGNLFTRYTLYRDRKAIVANLLVLFGYAGLASALALLVWSRFDHRVIQPYIGGHWWEWPILEGVFAVTVLRLFQKAYFVASIYGPQQGALALLRIPWAGVINAAATARAWWLVTRAAVTRTPLVWSKTAHLFPSGAALREYRRQLGEVLIESELVTNDDVALALAEHQPGERIGETLVRLGYLTQRQLVGALAKQIGAEDGVQDDLIATAEALALVPAEIARRLRVLPLRVEDGQLTVAVDDEPSNELDAVLRRLPFSYHILIVETARVVHGIERSYTYGDERRKPLGAYLLDRGFLTRARLERLLLDQDRKRKPLFELLIDRGFLTSAQAQSVLEEYFGLHYVVPPRNARIPLEQLRRIPSGILQDNDLALYESTGTVVVAAAFPIEGSMRDAIAETAGGTIEFVIVSADVLAPLRRKMLHEIALREKHTADSR
jgi:bacteriophage N4 adsorption protein B